MYRYTKVLEAIRAAFPPESAAPRGGDPVVGLYKLNPVRPIALESSAWCGDSTLEPVNVISWFQNLLSFEFSFCRYSEEKYLASLPEFVAGIAAVGLCTLNQVDP